MDAYTICNGCNCHVKTIESRCPFCGEIRVAGRALPRRSFARMSRARWLAFGSALALVRCTDSSGVALPEPIADAENDANVSDAALAEDAFGIETRGGDRAADATDSVDVASDHVSLDATSDVTAESDPRDTTDTETDGFGTTDSHDVVTADVAIPDATDEAMSDTGDGAVGADAVVDAVSDGQEGGVPFLCTALHAPPQSCLRDQEFCRLPTFFPPAPEYSHITCIRYDDPRSLGPYPSQCMPSPSCACLATVWSRVQNNECQCNEVDGAGAIAIDCAGCYGCPPARWERLRHV